LPLLRRSLRLGGNRRASRAARGNVAFPNRRSRLRLPFGLPLRLLLCLRRPRRRSGFGFASTLRFAATTLRERNRSEHTGREHSPGHEQRKIPSAHETVPR
jgi:hypothetical protein